MDNPINYTIAGNTTSTGAKSGSGGLTGVFDGNGHIISNLTTIRNGIFGTVYGALIKDIAFTDVDIKGSSYPCIIGHFGKSNNTTHKLKFSNIYVSVKSMASESSVLVNNGTDNSAILENIVIDYTAFGSKESGWLIGAGGRFGTVTDFTVNGDVTYDTVDYSIQANGNGFWEAMNDYLQK